jgi:hypothetical protein
MTAGKYTARWWWRMRSSGAVAAVWRDTGRTLKHAWAALWAAGVALLVLGVWGDHAGFWADKPYLTNVFSALTTAAFGVPLALVVVQRIAAGEADAAEARAAARMAARVSTDLALAAAAVADGGIPALHKAMMYLRAERDSLVPNGDFWRPATAPRLYYGPFIDAIQNVGQRADELFGPEFERHCDEVSTQWSMLTVEARSRLLAANQPWLTGLQVRELDELVGTVTGSTMEEWRRKGLELLDRYRAEDRRPGDVSQHYGELETLRDFHHWFSEIIKYIDAVIELATRSALMTQTLGSPITGQAGHSGEPG